MSGVPFQWDDLPTSNAEYGAERDPLADARRFTDYAIARIRESLALMDAEAKQRRENGVPTSEASSVARHGLGGLEGHLLVIDRSLTKAGYPSDSGSQEADRG